MDIDLRARAKEVLAQTHVMTLAVHDEAGVWAADVIFVYDDELRLYWISDPDTRHSRAIEADGEAAATITASTKSKEPDFGLQLAGKVQRLSGPRPEPMAKHFGKRGRSLPEESENPFEGLAWYEFESHTIHLIDEANFGFGAQNVP